MMKRILLAGILGGIAMFVWSSVAHLALPLGRVGIGEIPSEQAVLATMKAQLGGASGMYVFPGMGLGPNPTRQQQNDAMQAYAQKLAVNPSGLLIYHPPGAKAMTPGQLMTEFLIELLEAVILAFLLGQTRLTGFLSRLGLATLVGIVAAVTTNLPYWNWYGFPGNYTAAYMTIQVVDYIVAGTVAAMVLKNASGAARA